MERGGQSKEVADCCYDISLLDSLQKLLYMDSVQEQVDSCIHTYTEFLSLCVGLIRSEILMERRTKC